MRSPADARDMDHQPRVWYPALRPQAWRMRTWGSRGSPGLGGPHHGPPETVRGTPVQFADVITSFRRHWRAAVAAVLLVSVGLGLFLLLQDQTHSAERWEASIGVLVPARDDDGNLPAGVPAMLLAGAVEGCAFGKVTTEALNRAGLDPEADDVTFDYDTNERGDIIRLTVTAPTEEAARRPGGRLRVCVPGVASPGGRRGIPGAEPGGPGDPHHAPGTPRPGRGRAGPDRPRSARQPARHRRAARRGHRRECRGAGEHPAAGRHPARDGAAGVRAAGPDGSDRGGQAGLRREHHDRPRAPRRSRPWSSGTSPRTSRPSH